jgi:hypothetical protein
VLSSKARFLAETPELWSYFGRISGLPPGLPGGGITGVLPASGVGARISGSTPAGGHSTPSDLASLSAKGSLACPVVVPSGGIMIVPRDGADAVGAQFAANSVGGADAMGCAGLVTEGGACAAAPCTESSSPKAKKSVCFVMQGKRPSRTQVPRP